jgi:hypothetical protein
MLNFFMFYQIFIFTLFSENDMIDGYVWIHSDTCAQTNKYDHTRLITPHTQTPLVLVTQDYLILFL